MKPIFIAGPCVIESAELLDSVAARLCDTKEYCTPLRCDKCPFRRFIDAE